MNPLRRYEDNPSSVDEEINSHGDLWKAHRKLRIRQAVTDERVRWVAWAVGLLVVLHTATLGLVMVAVV